MEFQEVERIGPTLAPESASSHRAVPLRSNNSMCFQGVVPAGDGFKLKPDQLERLGFSSQAIPPVVRRYLIGRDLVQVAESRHIIDLFGLTQAEARRLWPQLYQWLLDRDSAT